MMGTTKLRVVPFMALVFRGFGQMFLVNHVPAGLCFFTGLVLLSPVNALWSLVGGVIVTGLALWRLPGSGVVKSGLFGVNGALLGTLWFLFPEVSVPAQAGLTVAGSLVMGVGMIPITRYLEKKKSPVTLFSVPYVVMAWLCVIMMYCTGQSDRHFLSAWVALSEGKPVRAEQEFAGIQAGTPRAAGYRADGLGWALFHRGDYAGAAEQFRAAILHIPGFADPYDGLGWSNYRMGNFGEAEKSFHLAVIRDPFLADSWDGLGWLSFTKGDTAEARWHFRRAAMVAPLFADAYVGLSTVNRTPPPHPGLMKHSSRLPVTQLLCWILFGAGVLWYSRLSFLFAACGVGVSLLCAWIFPSASLLFLNIGFLYNLLALCVALGGQYLRLRWVTFAWMAFTFAGLAAFWWAAYAPALSEGVPLLCLPFNVLLIFTVVVFRAVGLSHAVVPLELASAPPEQVGLLLQKKANADACWEILNTPHPNPLP